jgi:hypothetical protein
LVSTIRLNLTAPPPPPPQALRVKVESFLETFPAHVGAMSAEKFASNLTAVATQLADADKSVEAEASRVWGEITVPGLLNFARGSSEAAAVLAVTQAEVVDFFETRVKPGAKLRSALISSIERGADAAAEGEAAGGAEDSGAEGEAEAEASPSTGAPPPAATVQEDKLAGGGLVVLPPGLQVDAPLVAIAAALDSLSCAAAHGTPLSVAATAAAFSSAGVGAVADALLGGERIIRVQVVCATRSDAHSFLPLGPDLDTIKRASLAYL